MTDWPDQKIQHTALTSITKHSMHPKAWRWTLLGEVHPEILGIVNYQAGELPIVSFFSSEKSWYLLTTRRILGRYDGHEVDVSPLDVSNDRFGNFKGYGDVKTEIMTLQLANGTEVRLEYETFTASMAPIYYMTYWKQKYPILDKLKFVADEARPNIILDQ